jgi:hypothetical protein
VTDLATEHTIPQTLRNKRCTELSYRITVSEGKFDINRFSAALGFPESEEWQTVIRKPRDPKRADYHLHVRWKPDSDDPFKTKLQVDFHAWQPESHDEHGEPFAENFFEWAAQFFVTKTVKVHIHAEFEYPVDKWQSKILALPIKVPMGDETADIHGLSINLSTEPNGVGQVWLLWGKRHLSLQLFSDRRLTFKGFSVHDDVDAFVSVVNRLIEEKK